MISISPHEPVAAALTKRDGRTSNRRATPSKSRSMLLIRVGVVGIAAGTESARGTGCADGGAGRQGGDELSPPELSSDI